MGGNSCPNCRGDLFDDTTNNLWKITLVTTDSTASGLDPDEFSIDIVMSSGPNHQEDLASNSGSSSGGYTTFTWSISRPGTPVSGDLKMEHASLGSLTQDLTIS